MEPGMEVIVKGQLDEHTQTRIKCIYLTDITLQARWKDTLFQRSHRNENTYSLLIELEKVNG